MKTTFTSLVSVLSVALLALLSTNSAFGDGQLTSKPTVKNDSKTYEGTVSAVDSQEKTVTVKGTLFSKTFNVSDACQVSLEDKSAAALGDLRLGHKVEIQYQNAQGVLAAGRIQQHNLILDGYIASIDPAQRRLVIKDGPNKKELLVADNCNVMLRDEKVGTLENLKAGHAVRVAYETGDKPWTARKIEQRAEAFVGTIQAIDASSRTVKARSFMAERKFNLADGCRIVVDGKSDAGLRDLRIGDKVEFSYEEANGVLVANRIGRDTNTAENEGAHTAKVGR
jgi:Cu/Ag efflux protein CusF